MPTEKRDFGLFLIKRLSRRACQSCWKIARCIERWFYFTLLSICIKWWLFSLSYAQTARANAKLPCPVLRKLLLSAVGDNNAPPANRPPTLPQLHLTSIHLLKPKLFSNYNLHRFQIIRLHSKFRQQISVIKKPFFYNFYKQALYICIKMQPLKLIFSIELKTVPLFRCYFNFIAHYFLPLGK